MMLSVDGCIKSVKIYKNLEKFVQQENLAVYVINFCQFFFTNCRITIHYFLPYIYIYI